MKAQLWSLDFILSIIIFSLILLSILFIWNYTNAEISERLEFKKMKTLALFISDILIRSTGIPENWEENNVKVIGLAENENILNKTKVLRFINMDYNTSKRVLGIQLYDYYFKLEDLNKSIIYINQTPVIKGIYPDNVSLIIPIYRYGLLDDAIVKMTFILWL